MRGWRGGRPRTARQTEHVAALFVVVVTMAPEARAARGERLGGRLVADASHQAATPKRPSCPTGPGALPRISASATCWQTLLPTRAISFVFVRAALRS